MMKPLRIAIFTALYTPFLSGISVAVHQRVLWLLQQRHRVLLIHPECNHLYPERVRKRSLPGLEELRQFSSFSNYTYPTKPLTFYESLPEPLHCRYWSDTKVLETFQPDVVIVEEAPQMRGFYSLLRGGYGRHLGTEYAKLRDIPVVSLFHTDILAYTRYYFGELFLTIFRPLISVLVKRFSKAYDVNYFPSQDQLTKYEKMGLQRGKYVAYQGVDCQKFKPQNICNDPIPNDPRPTLLFVGRIAPEKNLLQLLEAFALILTKIPDAHLVIVGGGPQEKTIQKQAKKFSKSVTFWGESTGTELLGWFARADVFVNPSLTENFCTTTNEALASGTPVVAFLAPSTPEHVFSGVNGFLAEPNNPTDLAKAAIAILENADLKQKMSQQARQTALKFDWSRCMERFEAELDRLVRVK